jgi:hypothetical protein
MRSCLRCMSSDTHFLGKQVDLLRSGRNRAQAAPWRLCKKGAKESKMQGIPHVCFAVDEIPYCLWDDDIQHHNHFFIQNIDPRYFEHVAQVNGALLSGDARQYAAVALRTAYSQGLETFFSLLAATIQAPDCVIGWMLKYQKKDLYEVVRKIHNRADVKTKLRLKASCWDSVSSLLFSPVVTGNQEKDKQIQTSFAHLWRRFAEDFLDEKKGHEYNSIKHGFRIVPGGIRTYIGLQTEPGVPAPPERMQALIVSEYGSTFYVLEKLVNRNHFRVRRQSLAWKAEKFIPALKLVSVSIMNVLSFLKCVNGFQEEVGFLIPTDLAYLEQPWEIDGGNASFSFHTVIKEEWVEKQIKDLTPDKILSVYDLPESEAKNSD